MELQRKAADHIVPSYSLTGDLLSYLRCRLQYRYHNGSALPPSRPVQLWFGEFLHGTLEMAYRFWSDRQAIGIGAPSFPWPCTPRPWRGDLPAWTDHDIGRFADTIEQALQRQGKQARSTAARDSAYERVEHAVNQLGPYLFPLIVAAEQQVIGTRSVGQSTIDLRCENYEVHGVIDVLTNVSLSTDSDNNPISRQIQALCPDLTGEFEVIVDYKGTRRPLIDESYWEQGEWQIQTYAWLRRRQPSAPQVAAGVLIYINELSPGDEEIVRLKHGIDQDTTDVMPAKGSADERAIRRWRRGEGTSQLSLDYRLQRAIRVIPISTDSLDEALEKFDDVVRRIEEDIVSEADGQDILGSWSPNCRDDATCAACDFRTFCPSPSHASANYRISTPRAP